VGMFERPGPEVVALLLLKLALDVKPDSSQGKLGPPTIRVSRFRVSESTLKMICRRRRIPPKLLAEVQEILLDLGWALFFAGSNYAMIRTSVVDDWGRHSRKRISAELQKISCGAFQSEAIAEELKQELKAVLMPAHVVSERDEQ
jgi:hypothetical protein